MGMAVRGIDPLFLRKGPGPVPTYRWTEGPKTPVPRRGSERIDEAVTEAARAALTNASPLHPVSSRIGSSRSLHGRAPDRARAASPFGRGYRPLSALCAAARFSSSHLTTSSSLRTYLFFLAAATSACFLVTSLSASARHSGFAILPLLR